jgi:putative transposase
MLRDHGIAISMDGRGRCHDNIFVERLWWTVKHEWVYLRPATNGIEQKRSLAEFFDWYNLRRPHQALSWRTPARLTSANQPRRRWPPDRASAVPYGQAGENAMRFPTLAHRSAAAHKLHSTPQQHAMNLISGKGETSSRLPGPFSLYRSPEISGHECAFHLGRG